MKEHKCPSCGNITDDDWPITLQDGRIELGGCSECWEDEVDRLWWERVVAINEMVKREGGRMNELRK